MSIYVTRLVWKLMGLSATEKFVLFKLADCADEHGNNAFPCVDTISKECSYSRRSVQRALRRLEKRGLLEVDEAPNTKYRRSTTYKIVLSELIDGGKSTNPEEVVGAVDSNMPSRPKGATGSPQGRHRVASRAPQGRPKGATGSPYPSFNPHLNRPLTTDAVVAKRKVRVADGVEAEHHEIWLRVQIELEKVVGNALWRSWLADVELTGVLDGVITLSTTTKFQRDWLSTHYHEKIERAWAKMLGEGKAFEIKIEVRQK